MAEGDGTGKAPADSPSPARSAPAGDAAAQTTMAGRAGHWGPTESAPPPARQAPHPGRHSPRVQAGEQAEEHCHFLLQGIFLI